MPPPTTITLDYLGAVPGYVRGSMAQGSTTLTITGDHDIRVGHTVIVPVGGEAGAGARATVGVGGTWPATSYATVAALLASSPGSTTDGSSFAAYAQDTGDVYYHNGSAWVQPSSNLYHWRKFWPLALVAVVDAVDGNTITLDTAATVATTNARVWVDARRVIYDAQHTPGATYRVPAGEYALSRPSNAAATAALGTNITVGVTLYGDDGYTSILYSPPGCPSLGLQFEPADDLTMHDLLLRTNVGHEGGLNGDEGFDASVVIIRPLYVNDSDNVAIDRVKVEGCEWSAIELANCTDSYVRDPYAQNTNPRHYYTGVWNFVLSNCDDCHVYDPISDGNYIHIAAEMFRSTDCTIEGLVTRNGQISCNGSEDCWYDDLTITYTAGSAIPAAYDPNFTSNQSIAWTNNAGNASAGGGGVRGLTWSQLGDLGEGHAWDMVCSRSETLTSAGDDITFSDWNIDSGGRVPKAIIALDGGAVNAQRLNIDGLTADCSVDLDGGSIANSSFPVLRYDADTTTLGDGNTITTVQDVL